MSYANTSNRANPAAILGALGVPGAFGAVLVFGLAVTVVAPAPDTRPDTFDIKPDIPDEPPPPPEPVEQQSAQTTVPDPVITYIPPPRDDFTFAEGPSAPITELPGLGDGNIGPVNVPGPIAPMPALADSIAASPRGNPGGWVTDSDYRSNWIRKELTGSVGFLLAIDAKGKVTDCTVTKSSGHSELDQATCRLIQRRAKFNPGKDGYGNPMADTYRNTVNWRIPE